MRSTLIRAARFLSAEETLEVPDKEASRKMEVRREFKLKR
jgi:hypothetical protein